MAAVTAPTPPSRRPTPRLGYKLHPVRTCASLGQGDEGNDRNGPPLSVTKGHWQQLTGLHGELAVVDHRVAAEVDTRAQYANPPGGRAGRTCPFPRMCAGRRWPDADPRNLPKVTCELDGITMAGTLVRPDGDGPFSAVAVAALLTGEV